MLYLLHFAYCKILYSCVYSLNQREIWNVNRLVTAKCKKLKHNVDLK